MEPEIAKLRPIRTKLFKTHQDSTKLDNSCVQNVTADDDIDMNRCTSDTDQEPMTPAGRVFVHPSLSIHILVILGSKVPINLEVFKTGICNSLLKHKRFSSIVRKGDKGDLYWVPTSVNIEDHITVVEPNDADASSSCFVEDYVAKLALAPPLDMSKPLFEFHIVKAKLGDAIENVVFRVHHALGDGTSLMSLFLACTRKTSQPDSLPTLPSKVHRIRRTKTVYDAFFLLLWRFLLILWYTILDICSFMATMLWLEDSKTPIKGYAGIEKTPRKLAHKTVFLDDIRIVKQAIHGTVNDVVFAMVAAGLSRYLQQHYNDKADKVTTLYNCEIRSNELEMQLAHSRVRACVLVNTRPLPGLHELENMMRGASRARWGNDMGYVLLPVPISACENPLEYAHKAKSIIDKKKLSLGAAFSYKSGTMLMNLTGPEMPTRFTYKCTSHTTLAFSNVFGPLEEIQFFGHPVTHILPTVSGQPQALCVHVQSYMGKVTLIVSSAKDIIPNPEILCEHMARALEDMKQRLSKDEISNGLANGGY